MIGSLLTIVGLMAATYAVNAWKIQMVTDGMAMYAAALEGMQGLLFVLAITRIIDHTNSTPGALAYVLGAFVGTAAAVAVQARKRRSTDCPCTAPSSVTRRDPPAPRVHLPSS